MKRAIFLDRDGTLIHDADYLHKAEDVRFFPGVIIALKKAQNTGFLLIMVTNQSGVGRGYFSMNDVEKVHGHIASECGVEGVKFTAIYVAPEAPDQPSLGRKPSPYFLFQARDQFGIDLSESFMIGDKLIDIECGINAGVKASYLVRTGYGAVQEKKMTQQGRVQVEDDLPAAIEHILGTLS
ncbi:MAG: HAD family hydrolase [Verrucomicrobiota bacterium]|nr:HAD family hydrolase [Verrucomicrobiota bacterium]